LDNEGFLIFGKRKLQAVIVISIAQTGEGSFKGNYNGPRPEIDSLPLKRIRNLGMGQDSSKWKLNINGVPLKRQQLFGKY